MTRAVTSYLFGSVEFSMQMMGFSGARFNVTSKVMDGEQAERYERGMFDFGAESPLFPFDRGDRRDQSRRPSGGSWSESKRGKARRNVTAGSPLLLRSGQLLADI